VFVTVSYQQRGLPPTTIRAPYTVEANVADAVAVIVRGANDGAVIRCPAGTRRRDRREGGSRSGDTR